MLHLLTRPATDAHWTASWTTLVDQWGVKNPLALGVFDSIELHLDHWWKSLPVPNLAFCPPNLCLAINKQSKIGWQNLLDGFVAHQWDVIQSEFYEQTQSCPTHFSLHNLLFFFFIT
eukprot:scaffold17519_cov78-Attheya_sp.AAC.3